MPAGRHQIIWSPEARDDLGEIWAYYAGAAGLQTADNVLRRIVSAADLLTDYPLAGRARDELQRGIRSVSSSPHVIFYRLAGGGPEIVRVLDGRRDLDEVFAGDLSG